MGKGSDEVLRHLQGLQETLYRLFDEQHRTSPSEGDGVVPWAPAVDIYETAESFVLVAELPGMQQDDIHLEIAEDRLVLRGERPLQAEDAAASYHRVERPNGLFQRAFRLPSGVASDSASAAYRDGVLRVSLPKTQASSARAIDVEVG